MSFFIIPFSLWAKYLQRDTLNEPQFPWPMFEPIYYFLLITTWLRPVSLFQLHYAVQHESKNPFDLFWLFPPSTAEITIRYTTTSITFEYVVDKLEQSWATFYKEYCQKGGQKKPAGKKTLVGKKLGRKSG